MGKRHVRSHREGGFTLVELMVAIAIIAILSSLAIPMLSRYTNHAKIADARAVGQQVLNALAAEASNMRGNSLTDVDTCNKLARMSIDNGFYFSPDLQAQYCPAGAVLQTPVPGFPGRLCTCQDRNTGNLIHYDCTGVVPPQCSLIPIEPWDILFVLPILPIQDDLHVVASTLDGVSLVSGPELPFDGQILQVPVIP